MRYDMYPTSKSKLTLSRQKSRKKLYLLPLLLIVPIIALSLVSWSKHQTPQNKATLPKPGEQDKVNSDHKSENHAQKSTSSPQTAPQKSAKSQEIEPAVKSGVIQSGQTATHLLGDYLSSAQIYKLSKECKDIFPLSRLKAGQPYKIRHQKDNFLSLEYEIGTEEKLSIEQQNGTFSVACKPIHYDVQKEIVQATVKSSLFGAVQNINESPELAIRLAGIFAWDVDFVRDIRPGDSFKAVVEKRSRKGKSAGYGRILAAQFTNKGITHQAFLYTDKQGVSSYYDGQGKSVRKAFLKAPLSFSRISSGYSKSRFHPVLKVWRPHHGIDYAAPRGTPIKALGDGVIKTVAYAKGAGRYVKVRHPNGYVSVYNHMSRYARGLKRGKHVKQGETIGYVGSTGLSTGPHLDFRMKKYGKYVNPLKIKSPPVDPVPQKELARFKRSISPLMAVLEGKKPLLALAESKTVEQNYN